MIPTLDMVAAAWAVLRTRWPVPRKLLGPGPGFVEAIEAAFAVSPVPSVVCRLYVEARTAHEAILREDPDDPGRWRQLGRVMVLSELMQELGIEPDDA